MTYAKLILPYTPIDQQVNTSPKAKMSLKGKLTSALSKAGNAVKNAVKNPGQTMSNLGKYLQQNEDTIVNKFSGIAISQLLVDGKVTNKAALDYLFLGAFPALNQTYTALGYTGISQMKTAMLNGTINVGNFVNGFTKTLKAVTDLKNKQKNIASFNENNVIEIDIVYSHQEEYLSESGDRRVQEGMTWTEFIHNLPETFNLNCGLQDNKRYKIKEFKDLLRFLRQKRVPFTIALEDELIENVILQNFQPSIEGATNALDYVLQLKKVRIGTVESADIEILPLPEAVEDGTSGSTSLSTTDMPKMPYYDNNPFDEVKKIVKNKRKSWAIYFFEG